MKEECVALLGRCDKPTDAVEDYCTFLGQALAASGINLRLERVEWDTAGWPAALQKLRESAASWRGQWVLVQYTALAWSARGFPGRFLRTLRLLRTAGVRVGVAFHDVEPYPGNRFVDKLRRRVQVRTMRGSLDLADAVILTVPAERISWKLPQLAKVHFIPVGANLDMRAERKPAATETARPLTVAIFGITGGVSGERETRDILDAVRHSATVAGAFRLLVFGRHADEREGVLREGLRGVPVELSVSGVLDGPQVVEQLRASDILLFVRGGISSRRSSAIAGIAAGLPVIARTNSETAPPITEAGVAFYSDAEGNQLKEVLARLLQDDAYRGMLAEKSRAAYAKHFSWAAIAQKYLEALWPDVQR